MNLSTVQIKGLATTQIGAPPEDTSSRALVPEGIPGLTAQPQWRDPLLMPMSAPAPPPRISPTADKILRFLNQQGGSLYGDPAQVIATALGLAQEEVLLAFVELNRAGFMESKFA